MQGTFDICIKMIFGIGRWKMPWYFLSTTRLDEITWLQVPKYGAGEEPIPRLCLAPTVSQAILAIGGFGVDYFIHVVEVGNPNPSRFALDAAVTGEHVVTADILDAAGGSLPARCIGRVHCDGKLMSLLDLHSKSGLLPSDPTEELAKIWDMREDPWKYRLATS